MPTRLHPQLEESYLIELTVSISLRSYKTEILVNVHCQKKKKQMASYLDSNFDCRVRKRYAKSGRTTSDLGPWDQLESNDKALRLGRVLKLLTIIVAQGFLVVQNIHA
jgi:hypothetical protein